MHISIFAWHDITTPITSSLASILTHFSFCCRLMDCGTGETWTQSLPTQVRNLNSLANWIVGSTFIGDHLRKMHVNACDLPFQSCREHISSKRYAFYPVVFTLPPTLEQSREHLCPRVLAAITIDNISLTSWLIRTHFHLHIHRYPMLRWETIRRVQNKLVKDCGKLKVFNNVFQFSHGKVDDDSKIISFQLLYEISLAFMSRFVILIQSETCSSSNTLVK